MEPEQNELAALFPSVAAQMRGALSNLHLAAAQLAPAAAREQDPALDQRAALLDQSYYQLLRLVNSLSSAACLTDDQPLPLRDLDMVDLVGELCERAASLAPLLGLELRFVCALDRHICAVSGDALEQILYHLLSNAFKFTPAGGTVTVELRRQQGKVLLSVTDTGCGIPEERLATLFDRYRHPEQQDPPPHGLGLGLPLCRCLAERQGGALMAESRPGKGSRFTLSLPDRQVGGGVSDVPFDYSGGFNRTLLALADALPAKAFLLREQE
jgi:signal transduction histidine kinase